MGGATERIQTIREVRQIEQMLVSGMRNAASGWEDDHARKLIDEGFTDEAGRRRQYVSIQSLPCQWLGMPMISHLQRITGN